jgi:hypothetical protein
MHAHFQDLNFKQPGQGFAISRRITPELMSEACPSPMKRAQGRPGAHRTHGSRATKKARGRTTGTGGSSGLPCAMVFRLIRDLPGDHAWLPPSPQSALCALQDLAPASERQDHTTSPTASRHSSLDMLRPPHPAPRFVTIGRNAPLHRGGMGQTMLLICPTQQARRAAAH